MSDKKAELIKELEFVGSLIKKEMELYLGTTKPEEEFIHKITMKALTGIGRKLINQIRDMED